MYPVITMIPTRQEVVALAEKIAEAETDLALLQKQWDALFGLTDTTPQRKQRAQRGNSLPSRVMECFDNLPDRVFSVGDVADLVRTEPLKVGRVLFRLGETKRIAKAGRGLYRANVPFAEEETQ